MTKTHPKIEVLRTSWGVVVKMMGNGQPCVSITTNGGHPERMTTLRCFDENAEQFIAIARPFDDCVEYVDIDADGEVEMVKGWGTVAFLYCLFGNNIPLAVPAPLIAESKAFAEWLMDSLKDGASEPEVRHKVEA
jgi:hypothetical protein